MDPSQQLRNLRDFLLVYNRMTEICFQRCTSNFNYRNLTMDEERCVDSCAGKLIRSNHRLMGTYVQLMPRMVQRRMEEMESKAKAAEAAATVSTEAAPGPITTTSASPQLMSPVAPDVGPEAHSSVLKPAGLDIPVELDGAVSKSTVPTGVQLSAAAPLKPATETLNTPVLNKAGDGPSYTSGFPQPPESGSSVPVLPLSKPASLSEDLLMSTAATPTVSGSLSGQERAPEVPPVSAPQ